MCSIFFAYNAHSRYRLIVAANRDEFYERPTAAARFWQDAPGVLAGRDLVHGGTWLGVTRSGRFAAVTNYRDPSAPAGKLSRGKLVGDFLRGGDAVTDYLENIERRAREYSSFNLLAADAKSGLGYFSNRAGGVEILQSGVYGLSNHLLDTPWQKVRRGKRALAALIKNENIAVESLFEILRDTEKAADADLPDTGIGIERERLLSPVFIETPVYGTRSSTVVLIENDGAVSFVERNYRQNRFHFSEVKFAFDVEKEKGRSR